MKTYTNPDGSTVQVPDSVEIGIGATIGNCAKIGDYATIGENATIGYNAKIGYNATIGDGAIITSDNHLEGFNGDYRWNFYPGFVCYGCEMHERNKWTKKFIKELCKKHESNQEKNILKVLVLYNTFFKKNS